MRVSSAEVEQLCRYAQELREEFFFVRDTDRVVRIANELLDDKCRIASYKLVALAGLAGILRKAVLVSANFLYKKLVVPHLDEIYNQEIEEDVEEWCEANEVIPCKPDRNALVKITRKVKGELREQLSKQYFKHAIGDALKVVNPINIVKAAYNAIRKHGWRIGLKVALIIIIGDLIIPVLGGFLYPALFGILSATPHTEIAVAAAVVAENADEEEVLEWVEQYEEVTGDDLVKEMVFA